MSEQEIVNTQNTEQNLSIRKRPSQNHARELEDDIDSIRSSPSLDDDVESIDEALRQNLERIIDNDDI